MYRSHPTWREAKRIVDEGGIGELRHVQTFFGYRNDDPTNIRNIAEYGGGALMDVGCYGINSAMYLFGTQPELIGSTNDRHATFATDTVTSALLRFPNGTASLTCATAIEHGQWVHILGSNGRIEIGIPFNIPLERPTFVHIAQGGRPPEEPSIRTIEFPTCNQYTTQADAFAAHVLDGAPPTLTATDSIGTMRIIDKIFATAR
jgi:predicted dehydrogenase